MAFNFNTFEVRFRQLRQNVQDYLQDLYSKAGATFDVSSPYGQILQTTEVIFQNLILYLKNTVNQFDLSQPDNLNPRTIRSLARLAGHDPSRAQSAYGTIKLSIRPGVNVEEELSGSKLIIFNRSRIRNRSNSYEYFIELGSEQQSFNVSPSQEIFLSIVQGGIENQVFTGNGLINQSLRINPRVIDEIENNRILVSVNDIVWRKVDHLWDMAPDENAYFVRTGFDGGVEVWFGNGNFGKIPNRGDRITVQYVTTQGIDGNILQNIPNDWIFLDQIIDGAGNSVDVEQLFFVENQGSIDFGAESESVEYTKAIMPFLSRNFVLARPEQYVYQLKRLGIFSQVNAFTTQEGTSLGNNDFEDDSTIYLFLVPNFRNFLTQGSNQNYFTLSEQAFVLDDAEKQKIKTYLNTQGTQILGTSIRILDPEVSRYVLNIRIRIFSDTVFENVRLGILDALSDYFIENRRRDRIPRSDLIRIVEQVDGVDSVDVQIIGQLNEEYHKEFEDYKRSILLANPTVDPNSIILDGYDPDLTIGLDEDLGDIVLRPNQLALIRGGWTDRFGTRYDQQPKTRGLGSVNISLLQTVKRTIDI